MVFAKHGGVIVILFLLFTGCSWWWIFCLGLFFSELCRY